MKSRMRFIPIVIIVVVLGLGAYWLVNRAAAQDQGLKASGTIEATDVTLSPEIGGRVVEVLATDGDAVQQRSSRSCGWMIRCCRRSLKQVEANIQAAAGAAARRAGAAARGAGQLRFAEVWAAGRADPGCAGSGKDGRSECRGGAGATGSVEGRAARGRYCRLLRPQSRRPLSSRRSCKRRYDLRREVLDLVHACPMARKTAFVLAWATREEQMRAALNTANEAL